MYWLITALVLASVTFIYVPQAVTQIKNIEPAFKIDQKLVKLLSSIAMSGCILCAVYSFYSPSLINFAAIGFTLTSFFVAIPKLHALLLPSAIATATLLLSLIFQ
ncbi:hypothetical protein D5R81_10260 [Parashewanella spongiae]|uniref:DUF3325 domain-containing protein n=1 Tax=Parashewanella spongiae TaxID=342950 RepID=A0A3A6TT81_9GAMM|nr:hypothetical protein [Parashewanella spongiae]MCL1078300.1 hypothetical protein [Parashewanella spongiae]RJY15024.1 hypothetical protein D5R81_10260 [Parashewanella spongiae]